MSPKRKIKLGLGYFEGEVNNWEVSVIEPFLLKIYLSEIALQGDYALRALKELNNALQQKDTVELFRAAHSFLIHVSNVSKLLWPAKESNTTKWERAKHRAIEMRNILGLPEEHLLRDRKLRNHLEHYDVRLDEWAYDSTHHNYVDMNVGPIGMISGISDSDFMRNFDPNTNKFLFRGEEFDLQAIATAIDQIAAKVKDVELS